MVSEENIAINNTGFYLKHQTRTFRFEIIMSFMKKSARVAIYARFSTNMQNPMSAADQIRLCKELAYRHFDIKDFCLEISDPAISGETMDRPGIQRLLQAVTNGEIDCIITEALDRLSRRSADITQMYDLFNYHGVKIWTQHEGEVNLVHIGLIGTMNQLSNEHMRSRVRRSHFARAAEGRAPSGLAYGYRVVRGEYDKRGQPVNGLREIDPEKAKVVRRIYTEYGDGKSIRAIVRGLNNDNIPSPSGGDIWHSSSLMGSAVRQEGILFKEIYRGWLVHNKTSKVINPLTGRARYRPNPKEEHVRTYVPHLQIIDDEIAVPVEKRLSARRQIKPRSKVGSLATGRLTDRTLDHSRAHPLTNLIKCSVCGGFKSIANSGRYICSTNRYQKKCKNARGTRENDILTFVIDEAVEYIENFENWEEKMNDFYSKKKAHYVNLKEKEKSIQHRMDRFLEAVGRGVQIETVTPKILECERALSKIRLDQTGFEEVPGEDEIRTRLIGVFLRLPIAFKDERLAPPLRDLLSLVIQSIDLTPFPNQRTGEQISVKFKHSGWPKFYQRAKEVFPPKGK